MGPSPDVLLRVEAGRAEPEEIAAITALLLARATAGAAGAAPAPARRRSVGWRRPERRAGYRAPHSWQS